MLTSTSSGVTSSLGRGLRDDLRRIRRGVCLRAASGFPGGYGVLLPPPGSPSSKAQLTDQLFRSLMPPWGAAAPPMTPPLPPPLPPLPPPRNCAAAPLAERSSFRVRVALDCGVERTGFRGVERGSCCSTEALRMLDPSESGSRGGGGGGGGGGAASTTASSSSSVSSSSPSCSSSSSQTSHETTKVKLLACMWHGLARTRRT